MIGDYVKEKRNILGYTQKELAEKVGVTQSYVNLIELNKRKIGKKKIDDFAKILEISSKELQEKNNIGDFAYSKDITEQAKTKFNRRRAELNILIERTKKTLELLERARDEIEQDFDYDFDVEEIFIDEDETTEKGGI